MILVYRLLMLLERIIFYSEQNYFRANYLHAIINVHCSYHMQK